MSNRKPLKIDLSDAPETEDIRFVDKMIKQFNNRVSPHHLAARQTGAVRPLAVFLRTEMNEIVGGLTANTYWDWLDIDDFWIHEDLRGQGYGTRLLSMVEAEARIRGCKRAQLKTFGFQARAFYERHGYRVVGTLEDYPPGSTLYWMRKDFVVDDN